jgi:D-3-phosphoglycerate dehydrogenase
MTDNRRVRIAIAEGALNDIDDLRARFQSDAELVFGPVATPDEVSALTAGADAILVGLQPLRSEHMAALSDSVRIIARAGVGLDTIDVASATARGVRVVYQPNYATNEVADQAASMALASWRRLERANSLVRSNGWAPSTEIGPVHALQDSTLGVLGFGRIGRAVVRRLSPFVSRVVVFDAYPDHSLDGVEWMDSAEDLLAVANLLTLHLPLLESTRHIINARAIELLPRGAVVVNVSRGGLVDENALAEGLSSGKLAGAALDVFETEPLPDDSPLRSAPNLLLSPHVAWYSVESSGRLAVWSIQDAITFLASGELTNGSWANG